MAKSGFENGIAYMGKIVNNPTPYNLFKNPDFENWSIAGFMPSSAVVESPIGTGDQTYLANFARSTDANFGDYSLELNAYVDFGGSFISPIVMDFGSEAEASTMQATAFAKAVTVGAKLAIIYACTLGGNEAYYNFGTEAWGEDISFKTIDLTSSYQEIIAEEVELPEGNSDAVVIFASVGVDGSIIRIDKRIVLVDDADVTVDPQFDDWVSFVAGLSGWESDGLDVDKPKVTASTDANTGIYACKLEMSSTGGCYVAQEITKDIRSSTDLAIYVKGEHTTTGVLTARLKLFNQKDTPTQQYDFDDDTWVNVGEAVQGAIELTVTGTYEKMGRDVAYPASNKIYFKLEMNTDINDPHYFLVDTAAATEALEAFMLEVNETPLAEVADDQVLIRKRFGNDEVMKVDKDGSGSLGSLQWDSDGNIISGGS